MIPLACLSALIVRYDLALILVLFIVTVRLLQRSCNLSRELLLDQLFGVVHRTERANFFLHLNRALLLWHIDELNRGNLPLDVLILVLHFRRRPVE